MRIREIPAGDNISVKGDGRTIAGFSAGYPNLLRSTLSWKSTSGIQQSAMFPPGSHFFPESVPPVRSLLPPPMGG